MQHTFTQCLWKNFGASIDMLRDAISLCPDHLWQREDRFFLLAYHTTIFLDYYLSQPVADFKPPLPFTILSEEELPKNAVDDVIADRLYSKHEMDEYLSAIRSKCKNLISHATENQLNSRWIQDSEIDLHGLCPTIAEQYTLLEILFYNFRHVQHHVGQLNMILRKKANTAAEWVSLSD